MPYDHERMVSFLLNYYGERIKIFLKDLKDQMYTLQKCIDCQTIFQEFIPTDEFSNKLYEEIISPNKSLKKKLNFPVTQFNTYFNEMIAFENLFKKKSFDIKVLEFGAGWGFWSRLAQSLNFKVNVSEISATRNKFLKDNNLKLINELDKTNDKFDLIYSDQTFEHLNYPKEIFNSLYKILNQSGFIFLKFPNSLFFKKKINKSYVPSKDAVHPLEHINLFTINSFKSIIKDLNMSVINFDKYYNFYLKKYPRMIINFFKFDKILIKKN